MENTKDKSVKELLKAWNKAVEDKERIEHELSRYGYYWSDKLGFVTIPAHDLNHE